MAAAAALLAVACGARGTGEYRPVDETSLLDAGAGEAPSSGDASQLAEAIARWETGKPAVATTAEERACLGPAPERALTGPEMEQIFAAAFGGLVGSPRFVAARVARSLWEGDVLKANVAEAEGEEGARKIWLGEGKIERRIAYSEGGRPRQLVLRSSLANPQLVASGPSAVQREVVLLEVGVRYATGGDEVLVLVDGTTRLAAVLAREKGAWNFVRFADLKGVDETREALCRAIAPRGQ